MENTAPCPSCGQREAVDVGFTWWGGALGPKILHHVRCTECRTEFNGKTGQRNTTAIAIYVTISTTIALGIVIAFRMLD